MPEGGSIAGVGDLQDHVLDLRLPLEGDETIERFGPIGVGLGLQRAAGRRLGPFRQGLRLVGQKFAHEIGKARLIGEELIGTTEKRRVECFDPGAFQGLRHVERGVDVWRVLERSPAEEPQRMPVVPLFQLAGHLEDRRPRGLGLPQAEVREPVDVASR